MKKTVSRVLMVLMLFTFASVAAYAKEKSRTITFGQDFVVGDTNVSAGTYKVTYNDKTNELTFVNKKTKEVAAKLNVTTQACDKSDLLDMKWIKVGNKDSLVRITFAGDKEAIVISSE